MYPPRVSDADVRALIRELKVGSILPSGAAVRAALAARFDSPGGVARIYRLLSHERVRLTPAPEPGSARALQSELQQLREKLARAEEREDAHQARWAEEVDRLRQQLTSLEPLARQTLAAGESMQLLRRQLQASQLRASMLEQQLTRAIGNQLEDIGAGQGPAKPPDL
jgi:hypothetical protein